MDNTLASYGFKGQVCAEIQYDENEEGIGPVHSDLCPDGHTVENLSDEDRAMYHRCLDEWLTLSKGTGYFFIGDSRYYRFIPSDDEKAAMDILYMNYDGASPTYRPSEEERAGH
tara:strand:- start:1843 stop:2184 length:342 start_codon:yes stop_codon:yes gene_type:complete